MISDIKAGVSVAEVHLLVACSSDLSQHLRDGEVLAVGWCFRSGNGGLFLDWLLDSFAKKQGFIGVHLVVGVGLIGCLLFRIWIDLLCGLRLLDDLIF